MYIYDFPSHKSLVTDSSYTLLRARRTNHFVGQNTIFDNIIKRFRWAKIKVLKCNCTYKTYLYTETVLNVNDND